MEWMFDQKDFDPRRFDTPRGVLEGRTDAQSLVGSAHLRKFQRLTSEVQAVSTVENTRLRGKLFLHGTSAGRSAARADLTAATKLTGEAEATSRVAAHLLGLQFLRTPPVQGVSDVVGRVTPYKLLVGASRARSVVYRAFLRRPGYIPPVDAIFTLPGAWDTPPPPYSPEEPDRLPQGDARWTILVEEG